MLCSSMWPEGSGYQAIKDKSQRYCGWTGLGSFSSGGIRLWASDLIAGSLSFLTYEMG